MKKPVATEKFELGVCYYPEHWPENMWEDDYRRMRELGFTIIRMGEFAWSIFEPTEGEFQFGLFDRAIDLAHKYGLQVVLGTPTATPPAWLTDKYPEVLNVTYEGVTLQHGMRRHYNYSSPKYRELCARIAEQMAEHYGNHPGVVGWQIDNELNCEISEFYSESDHKAFREWLQQKYVTLEHLNEAWGAVFGIKAIVTGLRSIFHVRLQYRSNPILIRHWMKNGLFRTIQFLLPKTKRISFVNLPLSNG